MLVGGGHMNLSEVWHKNKAAFSETYLQLFRLLYSFPLEMTSEESVMSFENHDDLYGTKLNKIWNKIFRNFYSNRNFGVQFDLKIFSDLLEDTKKVIQMFPIVGKKITDIHAYILRYIPVKESNVLF